MNISEQKNDRESTIETAQGEVSNIWFVKFVASLIKSKNYIHKIIITKIIYIKDD